MRTIWKRFSALFRRGRLDRELSEEIGIHLAMQEEEFRRKGMDPAAARAAPRSEAGGDRHSRMLSHGQRRSHATCGTRPKLAAITSRQPHASRQGENADKKR